MKILLLGKNGQLGDALQENLAEMGELTALARSSSEAWGDLEDLSNLAKTIQDICPSIIVNAAAYTSVDQAETDEARAFLINAKAPAVLAEEARKSNALLVHYSTDYVFSGVGQKPWSETDVPEPLNVYGKSKRAGEENIRTSGCKHLIFRTSWIHSPRGQNFIHSILKLISERNSLQIVNDQIGAPTSAKFLAESTVSAIEMILQRNELSGLYHLAAEGETSWYDYACLILEIAQKAGLKLKLDRASLFPISSAQYAQKAVRPLNSRLSTAKAAKTFGYVFPNWEKGVVETIETILHSHYTT